MNDELVIFIMVYGRPDKMWTLNSLRRAGYTGRIYFVADDSDEELDGYKNEYGEDLIVFSKEEVAGDMDAGDNSKDLRSTLYSANTIFKLAEERNIKYFMIMCDDYLRFSYRFDWRGNFRDSAIRNLDGVLKAMLDYYKKTPILTLAIGQGGDYVGGKDGTMAEAIKTKRKAMNSFMCSTDRPFKFIGRLNEDVTTYVNLGSKGYIFLTLMQVALQQQPSQKIKGGLTEVYLDGGTYLKSYFSLMYNPSCIKIADVGSKNKRIHHRINWNNAVPKILNESIKIAL